SRDDFGVHRRKGSAGDFEEEIEAHLEFETIPFGIDDASARQDDCGLLIADKGGIMSNGDDGYLAAFLKKAGGDGVVKRALKAFPDAEWIDIKDIELKKTGAW